jgi:hypothetical protein
MENWPSELSVRFEKAKFVHFSKKVDYIEDFKAEEQ